MVHIFIVNPQAGIIDRTEYVKSRLERRKDIKSIMFITEEPGSEAKFMREMLDIFDDELVRIYICGGSGTLSNAIDVIKDHEFDNVEVAFFPCGYTNDYLKNFGDTKSLFYDLDALIDGIPVTVDYARSISDGNENSPHNELLFSAMGIIANIERAVRKLRIIGGISSDLMYTIASLISVPTTASTDYELVIDGVDYSREYKQIYIGNSVCLGGHHFPIRKNIDCRDGYLNVLLIKRLPRIKSIKYYTEFAHGIIAEKHPDDVTIIKCKEVFVKRKDGKQMHINSDGELHKANSWKMKVVSGKLKFVIPKEAKFCSDVEAMVASKSKG